MQCPAIPRIVFHQWSKHGRTHRPLIGVNARNRISQRVTWCSEKQNKNTHHSDMPYMNGAMTDNRKHIFTLGNVCIWNRFLLSLKQTVCHIT